VVADAVWRRRKLRRMDFIEWMRETHRLADQLVRAALQAAERADVPACADAARRAAIILLRRYLEAFGGDASGCDAVSLLEAAAQRDHYFSRIRAQAALLDAGWESGAAAEDIVDALKEIRFYAGHRAGRAMGFAVRPADRDPRLEPLVTHCTTVDRALSIFAHGALYSFNQCARRGLVSGPAIGVQFLLDPRRCTEFVIFGFPDHTYYAGEKVANSQRKGIVDEDLTEDYQPSVRLFFREAELRALPGHEDDGCHFLMVRDQVSLDLMVCAVLPNEQARHQALERVKEPQRRRCLAARCLVAPPECRGDPESYVRVTNEMVMASLV